MRRAADTDVRGISHLPIKGDYIGLGKEGDNRTG